MRSIDDVRRVFELWEAGHSKASIARMTGVSRERVRTWIGMGLDAALDVPMRRGLLRAPGSEPSTACPLVEDVDEKAYAYLLGQYLGDGCISAGPKDVYRLRIIACDAYPGIKNEIEAALHAVMPANRVGRVQAIGCTQMSSYSKHWPCLFPQHGPGLKHLRQIQLQAWQTRIAIDRHPQQFLRGLIHSDGCRSMNWVTRPLNDGAKRYTYARYLFSNESADILRLYMQACDRVGVDYRRNARNSVSVARRQSVGILEGFIGPKY